MGKKSMKLCEKSVSKPLKHNQSLKTLVLLRIVMLNLLSTQLIGKLFSHSCKKGTNGKRPSTKSKHGKCSKFPYCLNILFLENHKNNKLSQNKNNN